VSARVAVTDHAIARLLERAPRFKGMPEGVIVAAMGETTRAGTDPSGKVLLAPRAFPGLLFVVAEEARGPVVVSVVPHPAAGRGTEPSAELSAALLSAEIASLRAALDTAAAKLVECERSRRKDVARLTHERDVALNALRKLKGGA
jgi:hypothetical protein